MKDKKEKFQLLNEKQLRKVKGGGDAPIVSSNVNPKLF